MTPVRRPYASTVTTSPLQASEPVQTYDIAAVQRRTVRVLVISQILGGVGVASGISVGALLAARVMGREDLAGLVQSAQVLGAAVLALPAARLAVARGRRFGLGFGYGLAVVGAAFVIAAAQFHAFPLMLAGVALFGGATAAGLQARYAAIDLAPVEHRGRSLSVVVWATTIGAVAGPNLVDAAGEIAEAIGIEQLAGPFLISLVALAMALLVVAIGLRPDSLLLAQQGASAGSVPASGSRRGVLRHGLAAAAKSPAAILALTSIAVAHTVMVSVMVMTPIHMDHGAASLRVIGLVISLHIAGMYAFSPIVGWLSDRFGRVPVILTGSLILLAAVALAGTSTEGSSLSLGLGLFLLGLGWSFCLVAGSALITDAVPVVDRPTVQGASDLLMGLAAAGGGAVAGVVVGTLGFGVLNLLAGSLVFATLGVAAHPACRRASNTCSA